MLNKNQNRASIFLFFFLDIHHRHLFNLRNFDVSMRGTRKEYKTHIFLLLSFLLLSGGDIPLEEFPTGSHILSTNQCVPCPWYENGNDSCFCCFRPNRTPKNPKITALLQVRNVDSTLILGIQHLSEFCDSIVVLDDHSEDQTILELQWLSRYYPIEAIVYFTSHWSKRDELRDRQILLAIGRMIKSTHFVITDYDEIFAADCVSSGRLREHILQLPRGHSLYIPWVFPWNGTQYHAVPLHDGINLLNRSLAVIFADHKNLEYPIQPTKRSTQVSIHIGRIPTFRNGSKPNKKLVDKCKILDLRFISLDNLERKLLWYDALGRIFNIPRKVRGKVFRINEMQFCLEPMPQEWIGYSYFDSSLFYDSDRWRSKQLSKWKLEYPYLFIEECNDCQIANRNHVSYCHRNVRLSNE
ncbi:hypothetical protein GpartN1_g4415.t1 [Galdieria partita]|uniref:Uncharacterized protein n=1 Tax=Galdieria partita TaxID=83374 RepID=A0A9C7UR45_9RHOD|nr:hypothetical protein GpartN1_g4415.t1 [Galdieria partita]